MPITPGSDIVHISPLLIVETYPVRALSLSKGIVNCEQR